MKDKIKILEKTTKSFRTCQNKGFHLKFKNGWIVSIQFGGGNYGDNYDLIFDMDMLREKPDMESDKVEVWAWSTKTDEHYPVDPLGYQTIEQVMRFIAKIRKKK